MTEEKCKHLLETQKDGDEDMLICTFLDIEDITENDCIDCIHDTVKESRALMMFICSL